MRRFFFSISFSAGAAITTVGVVMAVSSCSNTAATSADPSGENDASHRDASIVEPVEGGTFDAGNPPSPVPECATYCDSVLDSCKDKHEQYGSRDECLAFCARLPPGKTGESAGNTVACRQFYAGSPSKIDAVSYCGAAGPFGGGGTCGDRCPVFCELALSACAPEAGAAPYGSYPDCQTACVGFSYKDGGVDGGGEPTTGPTTGNTLNCRLYYLREAITAGTSCENLGANSAACR